MARGQRRDPEGPKHTCPKVKQNGESCKREAGYQTDHLGEGYCRQHGGMAPGQRANAARVIAGRVAEREGRIAMAAEMDIDPAQALLWAVRLSAGTVDWLRKQTTTDYGFPPVDVEEGETRVELLREMWVKLYGEERDRLVRTAKAAVDAGIAERLVQIEEQQGQFMAEAMQRALRRLGLSAGQLAEAPRLLREELLAVPAPERQPKLEIPSRRLR